MEGIRTELDLVSVALSLGAGSVKGWSPSETALAAQAGPATDVIVRQARKEIENGKDPLGEELCRLRSPELRRPKGATYTPKVIVDSMIKWIGRQGEQIERVVDPGCGSGRFLVAAGGQFRAAWLLGVEVDPLAAMIARAHVAASGLAERTEVSVRDFRQLQLPRITGRTVFLGNPPYVRHHLLGLKWKTWLTETARASGLEASQLAGLHVHFFLATMQMARAGDLGVFITAAEWLDVNYGRLVRQLLLDHLGANGLHVIEPAALPFADTATTAVIACFRVATRPRAVALRRVARLADLGALEGGRLVRRERLEAASRWTPLTRPGRKGPDGCVELGELFRVHRGQVTGANHIWIAGAIAIDLPGALLFPAITRAKELFRAGPVLADAAALRRVIDLPVDLDVLNAENRMRVDAFLKRAKALGAHRGFIAGHRRAWWSVGLRSPAPILATYMARRPPAFVLNEARARHINIAHGLYPREPMTSPVLAGLAEYLSKAVSTTDGRTYAGGLTKFEPREMERLLVPGPALLAEAAVLADRDLEQRWQRLALGYGYPS